MPVNSANDVNACLEGYMYFSAVRLTLDKHAPLTTKTRVQAKHARWMTPQIKEARMLRRACETRWRRSRLEVHRQIFLQHRNQVHDLILAAKKSHYEQKLAGGGSRETFAALSDLMKPNGATLPAAPSQELADDFAQFFIQKVKTIRQNIATMSEGLPDLVDHPVERVSTASTLTVFKPVDLAELRRAVRSANNKTCGLDPCPTVLLKETIAAHEQTILDIFNGSLEHGVFPELFKEADVTPVLKKPGLDEQLLSNYRPVSNLAFLCKVLERIVADRLRAHIDFNNLGEKFQSAYQPNHSTETALVRVQNDISSALDRNRGVMLAMIDLSAAFDTIDHAKFIRLLREEYAVSGPALDWFTSYLSDRHMRVKVGDFRSEPHELICGVPQGSVLGPIIFNMYTKPLERIMRRHGLMNHKYADDGQLYGEFDPASVLDQQRLRNQLEDCLAEIRTWMLRNLLKINDGKTELIVFVNPQQERLLTESPVRSLTLGDSTIQSSDTVRNLGVVQDRHLSGGSHVSATVKSANFHLCQISRVRRYISDAACRLAVIALVISRLDYCNGLLSGATESQLTRLQRVQNRAARLIARPRVPRGEVVHITPILHQLHWLPVRQRVIYKLCVLVYKCLDGTAPAYLVELLQRQVRDARLRQPCASELVTHRPRRKVGRAGFWVAGPAAWNELPPSLRTIDTLPRFKSALKTHLWCLAYT